MDPLILIAAADRDEGGRLLDELGRHRRDDRLELVATGEEAVARLADGPNGHVAMVLADLGVGAWDGVEVLAGVRSTADPPIIPVPRPIRTRGLPA